MGRRGFFAELHYQSVQADKRKQQQAAAAARAHAAAVRAHERSVAASVRQHASNEKAAAAAAAKERLEAGNAEAAARTDEVTAQYAEIDSLLATTLGVDDYIDVASLRIEKVEHPPFDPKGLDSPTRPVETLQMPPEPVWNDFPEPTGLGSMLGGRKRHEEKVAAERARFDAAVAAWREQCASLEAQRVQREAEFAKAEQARLAKLAAAEEQYQQECQQREADAVEHNTRLEKFINDLAFDVAEAIEEYVGMVLDNSAYPDVFPVEHEHQFDLTTRELTVTILVPEPSAVPTVKEYKYVKAKDEMAATALTAKAVKDRYSGAVQQVALRTLHEVFEADRLAKIHSVSVTVAVSAIAAHSGRLEQIPLVRVAADRDTFTSFDLTNVVPAATLTHLGASLSKVPYDLVPAPVGADVRARKA